MTKLTKKKVLKRPFIKKNKHEHAAWAQNQLVCGIDEVGRGCLAGPVVTAAVILPPNSSYRLLRDSKLMTTDERNQAYKWIVRNCQYGLGIVHHRIVDQENVWHATLIAMRKAVMHLLAQTPEQPACLVVDAMPLTLHGTSLSNLPIHHFPFGEKKSSSIAAASILAKVKRDAMMNKMDKLFPNYAWKSNKGYGTKAHKLALKEHKPTIVHRLSYLKNINLTPNREDNSSGQQSIC